MENEWIQIYKTDKAICWKNTSTEKLKWIFFTYLDDESPLPKGWDRQFSDSRQQFYYRYVDRIGIESFTWDPPKKVSLQDMPEGVIFNIIEKLFENYPLEFLDTIDSLITALPSMRIIRSALDVEGSKHIFNIVNTKIWIHMIVSMGFDISLGEFREKVYNLWDAYNVKYQTKIVQECRYTSRAHDLLELKRSGNNLLSRAAIVLLDKLKEAEKTVEGKAFLNGDLAVKKINSTFEDKDIEFLDIRERTDLTNFFETLQKNVNLKYWDTSRVTNMKKMFTESVVDITGLENWNTSRVTDMSFMFHECVTFNCDISRWDTTNVQNMRNMFDSAKSFNQPIGSWNVINVQIMRNMFAGATSFNQPIGSWNVINVTDMRSMFEDAESFNQPIGSWNVINVKNMSNMFFGATKFNQPLLYWDTSNVKSMHQMFQSAKSFNQPISSWIIREDTNKDHMFEDTDTY